MELPRPAASPRPAPGRTARRLLGAAGLALALSSCGILSGDSPTSTSPPPPTSVYNKFASTEKAALSKALRSVHVALPTKSGQPAPSLAPGAFGHGLGSKVVLGFVPSWELSQLGEIDYSALSDVAYYAAQVEPGGTLLESGPGWQGLVDGGADSLVADAHGAGSRALLTLFSETQATLRQLAASPASSGEGLADRVAPLLEAHHFDGVDLDLEGQEASARAGFVKFVAAFSRRLHAICPGWSLVLNTFPQAPVDPESFFDVKALARYVDYFFVMAYDMEDQEVPGATAPLVGANLSDASSLASYEAVVPARKLILGIPFYGYDFTASGPRPASVTTGAAYAVTYSSVVATGRQALWDPASETPYVAFKRSGQWHQTWFDDPTSVALKVALAAAFHTAGVGAWELGMAAGSPGMTTVLDGGSPPARQGLVAEP